MNHVSQPQFSVYNVIVQAKQCCSYQQLVSNPHVHAQGGIILLVGTKTAQSVDIRIIATEMKPLSVLDLLHNLTICTLVEAIILKETSPTPTRLYIACILGSHVFHNEIVAEC